MLKPTFCAALATLFLMTGCEPKQSFDVIVTNKLQDPVTVWITRLRPTADPQWQPPEVAAVGTTQTQKIGGVLLKPGESAQRVVSGKFGSDDVAMLRVYKATDLNEILSIGRENPDRVDVALDPGRTDLDVVMQDGDLAALPHNAMTGRQVAPPAGSADADPLITPEPPHSEPEISLPALREMPEPATMSSTADTLKTAATTMVSGPATMPAH